MKNENKQKGFLSPEIVKLSERLAKDPTSKLFMPLAEEYIKAGMLEEAVMVLMDGLKTHPGFISAHVTLGKVYLEKGQIKEAKEQFETVIQASPDNLLAHRKLVKIYYDEGAVQQAVQSCRAVLSSNPKDEEMKKVMAELEARQSSAATAQKSQPEVFTTKQTSPEESAHPLVLEEELKHAEEPEPKPEPKTESVVPPKSSDVLSSPPPQEEQNVAAPPITRAEDEEKGRVVELKEEDASLEEILNLVEQGGNEKPAPELSSPQAPPKMAETELATESLAELYIKQGFYDKGVGIYQVLFSKDPENKALLQKLKDAISLSRTASKAPAEPGTGKTERPASVEMPNRAEAAVAAGEIHVEERSKAEGSHHPVSLKPSPLGRSKAEKIQKLQAWLERIKRSQKQ
jgi:tetratricopeptide (TPR) repeat protein